jgi:hypothetical protein
MSHREWVFKKYHFMMTMLKKSQIYEVTWSYSTTVTRRILDPNAGGRDTCKFIFRMHNEKNKIGIRTQKLWEKKNEVTVKIYKGHITGLSWSVSQSQFM